MVELFGKIGLWVCAAFTAVLAWMWRMNEKRIRELEMHSVRQSDLDKFRSDISARHEENKKRDEETRGLLGEISRGIRGTHERIDQLYRDLLNRD